MKDNADELDLPFQLLKTICKENEVSVPKFGHWKKLEFGKPVSIIPLDITNFKEDAIIDIAKYRSDYHNTFAYKLEQRMLEIEKESNEYLKAPLRLTSPSALVARARTYFSKEYERKYKGFEDVISTRSEYLSISVRKQNVPRALRIFDTLIAMRYENEKLSSDICQNSVFRFTSPISTK